MRVVLALALVGGGLPPLTSRVFAERWDWDLPSEHVPYQLATKNGRLAKACKEDPDCPYKEEAAKVTKNMCWGYEPNCRFEDSYAAGRIHCKGKSQWPQAQTERDQRDLMHTQGDFGYLRDRAKDMAAICESSDPDNTDIVCSDHLRYCYARNFFFDFRSLKAEGNFNKYREDVINEGEVGGYCDRKFNGERLKSRADHKSPLQSWAAELLPFQSQPHFRLDEEHCDLIFHKPTILIKLDASVSMFHHFCDFVNLYASQHLNGSFDRDVDIVLWDTSAYGYHDNLFGEAWKAFTANPLIQLRDLDGKKVCFRSAMLPLLARQRFGFYYNMPVIDTCSGTGFFHAFSKHMALRLRLPFHPPPADKVRITFLSRSTQYRKILNEDQLVNALKTLRNAEVRRVDFNHRMAFREQLSISHNTDLFIGMHGSGLTHCLFLPDWAALFEIYNCGDPACYFDLARLRGVRYRTWEKKSKVEAEDAGHHPTTGGPHEKFTNYTFDVEEFVRIVEALLGEIEADPRFIAARQSQAKDEL